jgi:pyrroline-5-carboxylate reductase
MTAAQDIWLIGAGNMGGAILRRWITADIDPRSLLVLSPSLRAFGDKVLVVTEPPADQSPTICVLAVKPQSLPEVVETLEPSVSATTIIVSMLAGVETKTLEAYFPHARGIVRIMPNLPVSIGKGVIPVYVRSEDASLLDYIKFLLVPLGHIEPIAQEEALHAITALVGGGPAFFFRYVDAFTKALEAMGLASAIASKLTYDALLGDVALGELAASRSEEGIPYVHSEFSQALQDLIQRALAASGLRSAEMTTQTAATRRWVASSEDPKRL